MMPTECPTCGEKLSSDRLHQGFLYCRSAHVLTVAPLHALDPAVLTEFACRAANQTAAAGQRLDQRAVAKWRARACR